MLTPEQQIPLTVEKPAAGGPMIARVDGQVVLVSGAIPGERVTARIERVAKGVAYARTVVVNEPSNDRREVSADPLCGGNLYAHIKYQRQLAIKAEVVVDAFARIGRITLTSAIEVRPSPESGYRMRARLHVRDGRAGFFREGTHELCDPGGTRQLLPGTVEVIERLAAGLRSLEIDAVREIDISENSAGSERAVHLETAARIDPRALGGLAANLEGVTGLSVSPQDASAAGALSGDVSRVHVVSGDPRVSDRLSVADRAVTLQRHVLSFFQGNRFLLQDLVAHVVGRVEPVGEVVDLYAGVGLFAIAVAGVVTHVTAVEGDRVAARDLEVNARQAAGAVEAIGQAVETFVARTRIRPRTVILDPPRTGVSRVALEGAIRLGATHLIYVSCDVATLARDSRHLMEAGYVIRHVEAFDLFPNTPHVETVVAFDRT